MDIRDVIERRRSLALRLKGLQSSSGYWEGELSSDAQATCAAVLALSLAGHASRAARGLEWLQRCLNADGGCGFAPGEPSDPGSSASALAAFSVADRMNDLDRGLTGLRDYWRRQGEAGVAGASLVLLHLAGEPVQRPKPRSAGAPLPYPERMMGELIRAYEQEDRATILSFSREIHGARSWRGLVTITGAASAMLSRLGEDDSGAIKWLCDCQNEDGGFPHTNSLAVWDTLVASIALFDAGIEPGSAEWLARVQDASGGWYWDADSRSTVDFDDSGYGLWVLLRSGMGAHHPSVQRAMAFLRDSQSEDGGFATFEAPGRSAERIYWNVGTSDVTGHVLQGLRAANMVAEAERAENWLVKHQVDGLWRGLWFSGDLYSTLSAVESVSKGAIDLDEVHAAVIKQRNPDGGFGCGGTSTVEETAWGISLLTETKPKNLELVEPSLQWLVEQTAEGCAAARVGMLPLFRKRYSDSIFPIAYSLSALNKYLNHVV